MTYFFYLYICVYHAGDQRWCKHLERLRHDSFVFCDMTHPYVWHDWLFCVTQGINDDVSMWSVFDNRLRDLSFAFAHGVSHVTHMNESRHIYEWVSSYTHMNESRLEHLWMSHVTFDRRFRGLSFTFAHDVSHATHMNESRLEHLWMSHVTFDHRLARLYSWLESCHTYEWVMSHMWVSHVTGLIGVSIARGDCKFVVLQLAF